jgi:carbonic anhydrase
MVFDLLQFHFHTPSEHHIGGGFAPMEVHFVHKKGSNFTVIGIMIEVSDIGVNSTFMTPLNKALNKIQKTDQSVTVTGLDLNLAVSEAKNFLNGFYTYDGSLTTPPCSEGINWVLAKDPLYVSAAQWNEFKSVIKYSARQTQRRNFGTHDEHDDEHHSGASSVAASILAAFPMLAQFFL